MAPQPIPIQPIPAGGFAVAAAVFLLLLIVAVVGAITIKMLGRKRASLYALIIDPQRRRIDLEELEEVATNVYRARDSGDLVVVPEDAATYTLVRKYTVYPVVRMGKRLAYHDPSDIHVSLVLDGKEYSVEDVAELIALLYSKGKISGGFRVSPSMSLSIYMDARSAAKRLTELVDRTIEDAIVGIANMTGARKEFEELVENIMKLERTKAETFERRAFTILAVVLGILVTVAIVMAILHK